MISQSWMNFGKFRKIQDLLYRNSTKIIKKWSRGGMKNNFVHELSITWARVLTKILYFWLNYIKLHHRKLLKFENFAWARSTSSILSSARSQIRVYPERGARNGAGTPSWSKIFEFQQFSVVQFYVIQLKIQYLGQNSPPSDRKFVHNFFSHATTIFEIHLQNCRQILDFPGFSEMCPTLRPRISELKGS